MKSTEKWGLNPAIAFRVQTQIPVAFNENGRLIGTKAKFWSESKGHATQHDIKKHI